MCILNPGKLLKEFYPRFVNYNFGCLNKLSEAMHIAHSQPSLFEDIVTEVEVFMWVVTSAFKQQSSSSSTATG
jgi:hypothetical protein